MAGPTSYQRVGNTTVDQTDYDWQNFPKFWRFDGVDDSWVTASIDFSATDKMSVFAGVRRNASTASIVYELSSTFNSNNGSFVLISGTDGSTTDGYTFKCRGDINTTLGARVSNLTPPNTSVVYGSGNISSDLTTMRINAVAGTDGTQDQGVGNFGNYPLYIGQRGGSSVPFPGRIYSLIVLGRTATAAEITATEAWVANKTGVTL